MSAKKACFQFAEVQLFFCKDMIFPRNFHGFWEKILERDEEKEKIDDSRIGEELPIL